MNFENFVLVEWYNSYTRRTKRAGSGRIVTVGWMLLLAVCCCIFRLRFVVHYWLLAPRTYGWAKTTNTYTEPLQLLTGLLALVSKGGFHLLVLQRYGLIIERVTMCSAVLFILCVRLVGCESEAAAVSKPCHILWGGMHGWMDGIKYTINFNG